MIEVCSLPAQPRRLRAVSAVVFLLISGLLLVLMSLNVAFWAAAVAVSTGWLFTANSRKHLFGAVISSTIVGSSVACLVDTMSFPRSVMERSSEYLVWTNAAVYAFGSMAGAFVGLFRALK